MRLSTLALLSLLAALTGCDGDGMDGSDAGSGMDAGAGDAGTGTVVDSGNEADAAAEADAGEGADAGEDADAGSTDAGSTDAGSTDDAGSTEDAGMTDAGATDAGMTDAGDVDAGCSGTCATPPPLCGTSCSDACGCCECAGPGVCRDGAAWNCAGDCITRTACGDSDCAVDDRGVASCGTCDALERAYMDLVSGSDSTRCENPDSCQVLFGHCGVGLGGCHYGVNRGVTQAQLDTLAAQWTARGCDAGAPVCRCAAPPSVRCDAGGCLLGSFSSGS